MAEPSYASFVQRAMMPPQDVDAKRKSAAAPALAASVEQIRGRACGFPHAAGEGFEKGIQEAEEASAGAWGFDAGWTAQTKLGSFLRNNGWLRSTRTARARSEPELALFRQNAGLALFCQMSVCPWYYDTVAGSTQQCAPATAPPWRDGHARSPHVITAAMRDSSARAICLLAAPPVWSARFAIGA